MRAALLLLTAATAVSALLPSPQQLEVLRETVKTMLDLDDESKVEPHWHSRQMRKWSEGLFEKLTRNDGSDDGNVVRSIAATVGSVNGDDAFIFDISSLENERVMRAEVHFPLRRTIRRRSRAIRARALCQHAFCRDYDDNLQALRAADGAVTWDATEAVAQINAIQGKQLAVRVSRRDVRMRGYKEIVKRNAPFLSVFSIANNTLDAQRVRRQLAKRVKRQSFQYSPFEPRLVKTEVPKKKVDETKLPLRSVESVTARIRALRTELDDESTEEEEDADIWQGFGEDEDQAETTTLSNDVRVHLLGSEMKACSRSDFLVDFEELGLGSLVISPPYFEAGICGGRCPTDKPNIASNHAILQSLLAAADMPEVCCAPDKMHSLTLFYKGTKGEFIIKNFPKMIVKSCACL